MKLQKKTDGDGQTDEVDKGRQELVPVYTVNINWTVVYAVTESTDVNSTVRGRSLSKDLPRETACQLTMAYN